MLVYYFSVKLAILERRNWIGNQIGSRLLCQDIRFKKKLDNKLSHNRTSLELFHTKVKNMETIITLTKKNRFKEGILLFVKNSQISALHYKTFTAVARIVN